MKSIYLLAGLLVLSIPAHAVKTIMEGIEASNNAIYVATTSPNIYVQTAGTMTVVGNAFSVGGSTLVVNGGKISFGGVSGAASFSVAAGTVSIDAGLANQEDITLFSTAYGIGIDGSDLVLHSPLNGSGISFKTNTVAGTSNLMRIQSNGNVGIGTTSPGSSLEVWNASSGGTKTLSMGGWSTWTPTISGCTTAGTVNYAHYNIVGRALTLSIDIQCTSNSTSFTFTAPIVSNDATSIGPCLVEDNGSFLSAPGYSNPAGSASNSITLFKTFGTTPGWTNSGVKRVICSLTYETN